MAGDGLQDRLVVVTGASRGIGREIARSAALRGARLILIGRDSGALEDVARSCENRVVKILPGDVADRALAAACRTAAYEAGGCDALVNAAGVFPAALLPDLTEESARRTMETNFFGVLNFCQTFVPDMIARQQGCVVNVSSLAARAPTPGLSVYAASKAAVEAFSRAIATEAAPHVRINCLSPGPTWTEAVETLASTDTTGAVDAVTRSIPMERYGHSSEIAAAALFLMAGEGSAWMTGQTLQVNGGALMV